MSKEQQIIANQAYLEETKELRKHIEGAFLFLGEKLYKIYEDEMWNGSYGSYEEFLKDLDLTPGNASKLRKIYATFILEQGFTHAKIAHIGQRKLYSVIPLCTDKKTTQGILENINGLHSRDVDKMVHAKKAGKHKHEWITYRMCEHCKESNRIYE